MKMLFNVPKRLVLTAILTAVMLTLCFASIAGATSIPIRINPCSPGLSPASQTAAIGQPVTIHIKLVCPATTGQPVPIPASSYYLVAWGDGSVSTTQCIDICPPVSLTQTYAVTHTYKLIDDYHPTVCLITDNYTEPSCNAVQVIVYLPPPSGTAISSTPASSPIVYNPCTIVGSPTSQTTIVKLPVTVNIHLICTTATSQPPFSSAIYLVAWGDGSVSTNFPCFGVCPLNASSVGSTNFVHTYETTDNYYVTLCLIAPSPYSGPACSSVQVIVKGIA